MPKKTVQPQKKRRGPPPTGKGTPIQVRLQPPVLAKLDALIGAQGGDLTRPEAIRQILEFAISPDRGVTPQEEGFFSPLIVKWSRKNRAANHEWFALADRLRRLSQRLLFAVVPPDDRNSIVMLLIFARAVTSYQAALLLIERGLPADSRTLARSFLETTMHYGAATKDPKFFEKLVAADRDHKVRVAKPLVEMGIEKSGLEPRQIEALEAWLADPDATKPEKLPIQQLMKGMELGDIYDTYFRGLSGDAAHTTVLSLNRHAAQDSDGMLVGTKWGPDNTQTSDTLMTLCSIMFYLLRWVASTLAQGDGGAELESCWAEYKRLVGAEATREGVS